MASGSSTLDDGERRGSLAEEGVDLCFTIGSDGRRRSVRFNSDENIIPTRNTSLLAPAPFGCLRPVSEHVLTPVPSPLPPEFSHRGSTTSESLRDDQYLVETLLIKLLDDLNNDRFGRPDVHYLTACCVQSDCDNQATHVRSPPSLSDKINNGRDLATPPMLVINSFTNFCLDRLLKNMTFGSMTFDDLCKICGSLFNRGRRASSVGEDLAAMMKRAGLIQADVSEASRLLRLSENLDNEGLNDDDILNLATMVVDACEFKGIDVLSGIRRIIQELGSDKLKVESVSSAIISSYDVIAHRKQEAEMTWTRDILEQLLIHHVFTGTVREKIQHLTDRFEKQEVTQGEEVVEDLRNLLLNAGKKVFSKSGNPSVVNNPNSNLKYILDCVQREHLQEEYFWEAGQSLEDFFSDVLLCPISVAEARTRIVVEKLRFLKHDVDNGQIIEPVAISVISSVSKLSPLGPPPSVGVPQSVESSVTSNRNQCPSSLDDSIKYPTNCTTENLLKKFLEALEEEEVGYDDLILVLGSAVSFYGETGKDPRPLDKADGPGTGGAPGSGDSGNRGSGCDESTYKQVKEILDNVFKLMVQTIISDVIGSLPEEKISVKVVESVVKNELFGERKTGSTGLGFRCDQLVRNYIDQVAEDLNCCRADTKPTEEMKQRGHSTVVVDFIISVLESTISKVKSSAILSSDLAPVLCSLTGREMVAEKVADVEEILVSIKSDLQDKGLKSIYFISFVGLFSTTPPSSMTNKFLEVLDLQILKSFTESIITASLNYIHNAPVEQLGVTMDTELTSLPCQGYIRGVIDDVLAEVMKNKVEEMENTRKSCILDILKQTIDKRRTHVLDKNRKVSGLTSGLEVAIINCLEGIHEMLVGRTDTAEVTEELIFVTVVMQDMIDVKLTACQDSGNQGNSHHTNLQCLKHILSTIQDSQHDRHCQSILIPPKTWLLLSQICIQVLNRTLDWITNTDSREQLVGLAQDVSDKETSGSQQNSFQSMNGAMLKEYITEILVELNEKLKSGRVEESTVCRMVVQIITSSSEQSTNLQTKSNVTEMTPGVTIATRVKSVLSSLEEKLEKKNNSCT